jgi:SPP1 gp7 family putative phage head morphogenesis protein
MAISSEILDRYISHRTFLIRYENTVAREILEILLRGEEQALGAVAKAYEAHMAGPGPKVPWSGQGAKFKVRALKRIRAALRDILPEAESSLRAALLEVAKEEALVLREAVHTPMPKDAVPRLGIAKVPERQLASLVADRLGDTLDGSAADILTGMKDILGGSITRATDAIADGIRDGRGIRGITRGVRHAIGPDGPTGRQVQAYVRTVVQGTANDAAGQLYRENSDLVRAEQFVATLDDDTCEVCGPLDGQVFPIPNKGGTPRPPRHVNCRCFMAPVLKRWDRLGLGDNAPKELRRLFDGAPAQKKRWSDWVQEKPERMREVLGPSRADLVRSGKVSLRGLSDANHTRTLTLKELGIKRGRAT